MDNYTHEHGLSLVRWLHGFTFEQEILLLSSLRTGLHVVTAQYCVWSQEMVFGWTRAQSQVAQINGGGYPARKNQRVEIVLAKDRQQVPKVGRSYGIQDGCSWQEVHNLGTHMEIKVQVTVLKLFGGELCSL